MVDSGGTVGERGDHFLLHFGGFHDDRTVIRFRDRKVELVARLDVRYFPEHGHELREVEEFCKSCPRPVACPLRRELDGGRRFPEGRGPAVEV